MSLYKITLLPKAPLMVSGPTMGNYRTTLDYIPGSSLRGAIAQKLSRSAGQTAYEAVFQHGDAPLFFDLLPTGASSGQLPRRMPPTALSCKRYPGFWHDVPGELPRHGIIDSLIQGYTARKLDREFLPVCSVCKAELQRYGGYYADQKDTRVHLTRQATTHVGIGRRRSTAEDSFLYTRVALDSAGNGQEDLAFVGLAWLSDSAYQEISNVLQTPLWIGGNRSRGMGKAEVSLVPYQPSGIRERIRNFNASVLDALEEAGMDTDGAYFCLDTLWIPSPLDVAHTIPPIRLAMSETLVYQAGIADVQAGWHAVAGIPRRSYPVIFGSYLYRVPNLDDDLIVALEQLEASPIGAETERGYGLVTVCDSIHEKDKVL